MSGGLATQGYTQKHLVSIISAAMCLKAFPYLGFKGIAVGIGMGMSEGIGVSKGMELPTMEMVMVMVLYLAIWVQSSNIT